MIVSEPAANVASDRVATLFEFKADVPNVVVPLENVTVPVGVPLELELTVAVMVTDCSKLEGLAEEISAMLVLAFCTTWFKTGDVLGSEFVSPPYTAVML